MADLTMALRALGYSEDVATQHGRDDDAPDLAMRGAFLRLLSDLMIDSRARRPDGEHAWIEGWLRWSRSQGIAPDGPAASLARVLAAGADANDLTAVVRACQADVIHNVCQLLDGAGLDELRARIPELPARSWRLYQVEDDEDFVPTPLRPIESLHESVQSFDPEI